MQAIVLAAGMGRRLKELTQNNTKCMVKVNGRTLIDRLLHQIDRKQISKIIIVVGYEGQKLIDYIESEIRPFIAAPIEYINNPIFDKTNNIYSLGLAKQDLIQDDTLLFESDLIFEDSVIDLLLDDPRDTLALVDRYQSWMDGTCLRLDDDDNIVEFISGKQFDFSRSEGCFKTVNIYKFSKEFSCNYYVPFLDAYCAALGNNEYYEQVLRVVAMLDKPMIRAKRLDGQVWYEIDDIQDLDIASSLFAVDDEHRLELIERRYGGYWRYPGLVDFCYLVNPYYPSAKMIGEMKASFETLLTQYPSGMSVNSLLAAKYFGINQDNIIVGNGAAELINAFMSRVSGKIGIIRPTFEEYPNRYDASKTVAFVPQNEDFSFTADDLMNYFGDKDIRLLVLINPDNPTGNYVPYADLLRLVRWSAEKSICLLVDESFVDFASEENTLIDQTVLNENPQLVVMKSISKSYGVPGLRLGVLASSDRELIAAMKKDVSIWNINSFAEFYMQIAEKYKKDYNNARVEFLKERNRFMNALSCIEGLRVYPSEANYFMIELLNGCSSRGAAKYLLSQHNLFIKDLSAKIKRDNRQFIRVAVRNSVDNDLLVSSLKQYLSGLVI
jgi:histidinol-phosphate/aromatic aminotransferase/cobyric acid decarboxylase-like protein